MSKQNINAARRHAKRVFIQESIRGKGLNLPDAYGYLGFTGDYFKENSRLVIRWGFTTIKSSTGGR